MQRRLKIPKWNIKRSLINHMWFLEGSNHYPIYRKHTNEGPDSKDNVRKAAL
jgi:hypothetical protein